MKKGYTFSRVGGIYAVGDAEIYNLASHTEDGLMSKEDKKQFDNLEEYTPNVVFVSNDRGDDGVGRLFSAKFPFKTLNCAWSAMLQARENREIGNNLEAIEIILERSLQNKNYTGQNVYYTNVIKSTHGDDLEANLRTDGIRVLIPQGVTLNCNDSSDFEMFHNFRCVFVGGGGNLVRSSGVRALAWRLNIVGLELLENKGGLINDGFGYNVFENIRIIRSLSGMKVYSDYDVLNNIGLVEATGGSALISAEGRDLKVRNVDRILSHTNNAIYKVYGYSEISVKNCELISKTNHTISGCGYSQSFDLENCKLVSDWDNENALNLKIRSDYGDHFLRLKDCRFVTHKNSKANINSVYSDTFNRAIFVNCSFNKKNKEFGHHDLDYNRVFSVDLKTFAVGNEYCFKTLVAYFEHKNWTEREVVYTASEGDTTETVAKNLVNLINEASLDRYSDTNGGNLFEGMVAVYKNLYGLDCVEITHKDIRNYCNVSSNLGYQKSLSNRIKKIVNFCDIDNTKNTVIESAYIN